MGTLSAQPWPISIITISSSEKSCLLNLRKIEEQLSQLFNEIELEFGIKLIMGVQSL